MVIVIILCLIALTIIGLSRLSDAKTPGGTSLRRSAASHVNANGSPKHGYVSMDTARDAARMQSAASHQLLSAYKCATCMHYHIGHS